MTIDIVFKDRNKLVLCINMTFSSFWCKILSEFTEEEQEKWIPILDEDETFTNKEFIERVWNSCVWYRYISEDYDIMGKFLDEMIIEL